MTIAMIFVLAVVLTPIAAWLASLSSDDRRDRYGKALRGRQLLSADELQQVQMRAENELSESIDPDETNQEIPQ